MNKSDFITLISIVVTTLSLLPESIENKQSRSNINNNITNYGIMNLEYYYQKDKEKGKIMNCKKCNKSIETLLSSEKRKIDLSGIEKFNPQLQEYIKKTITRIHMDKMNSSDLLEVCSNKCYNYTLYSYYLEFLNRVQIEEEMLDNIIDSGKEIEEERAKNINLQVEFVKEKIELYK